MKKILFYFLALLFLNGCFQSTAMVGPAMTFATTGNIFQAGFTFGANEAVHKETGMYTGEYVASLIEEVDIQNKRENGILKRDLYMLVQSNYKQTRKLIIRQSLVKSNYKKTRKIILNQIKNKKIIN